MAGKEKCQEGHEPRKTRDTHAGTDFCMSKLHQHGFTDEAESADQVQCANKFRQGISKLIPTLNQQSVEDAAQTTLAPSNSATNESYDRPSFQNNQPVVENSEKDKEAPHQPDNIEGEDKADDEDDWFGSNINRFDLIASRSSVNQYTC